MEFRFDCIDRGAFWAGASEDVIRACAIAQFGEFNRKLSNGAELRFGKRGSKAVALRGEKRGSWYDHEQQDGGYLRIPATDFEAATTARQDGTFSLGTKMRDNGNQAAARALWDSAAPFRGSLAEAYLAGRGITRWVPEARVRFHPAGVDGKPCIVFAVTDRAADVVAVQRVPLLGDGSDRDRAAGKKSLGPVSAGFFCLADPKPKFTVITEGPEDALAIRFAAHENIAAPDIRVVAMLGQRWDKAAETFPGAVFFADTDSVDRAREAAVACGGYVADPQPHKDANEILLRKDAITLWDRVANPVKAEAEAAPEFIRVADLAHLPVPARQWLVDDLVPGSTVTTLSGDGGVGKSLLALQLAICTSLGLPWAGRAIEAAPALFITAEDDLDEVMRRLHDIADLLDHDLADMRGLEVMSLAGFDALMSAWDRRSNTMAPTALFETVETRVRDIGARLVIFDTLADLHSGQENDRAHARQVIAQFRGMALRRTCAVLLLAHPSLTGMATGTGTSGSTAWNNSVRSRLYLARVQVDGEEADPDLRKLTTKKANYGPVGAEVIWRWQDGAFKLEATDTGLDRVAAEAKAERVFMDLLHAREAQGRPVSHISGTNYAPAQFATDPAAEGVSKAQFRAAMDRLFAARKVEVAVTGPPSKQRKRIIPATKNEGFR